MTPEEVSKIAHLARLALSEQGTTELARDMENILNLVAEMDQENTQDILPLSHPFDQKQPLRPDAITETNQRELFLKNAPQTIDGLYVVPKVIETE